MDVGRSIDDIMISLLTCVPGLPSSSNRQLTTHHFCVPTVALTAASLEHCGNFKMAGSSEMATADCDNAPAVHCPPLSGGGDHWCKRGPQY